MSKLTYSTIEEAWNLHENIPVEKNTNIYRNEEKSDVIFNKNDNETKYEYDFDEKNRYFNHINSVNNVGVIIKNKSLVDRLGRFSNSYVSNLVENLLLSHFNINNKIEYFKINDDNDNFLFLIYFILVIIFIDKLSSIFKHV